MIGASRGIKGSVVILRDHAFLERWTICHLNREAEVELIKSPFLMSRRRSGAHDPLLNDANVVNEPLIWSHSLCVKLAIAPTGAFARNQT